MNQPNSPVIATRSSTAAEGPDLLAALRRYTWLLISGAVAGAAVSGGLFAYCQKYEPRYTARIPYRITPPPTPIGSTESRPIVLQADDMSQLVYQQQFIFGQDAFLLDVMKDEDFQRDHNHADDPRFKTQWLVENGTNPRELKKALVVQPKINAASFELTMTSKDPLEAFYLVQAAAKVYDQHLKIDSDRRKAIHQSGLKDALKSYQTRYNNDFTQLQLYADSKGIDVAKSRLEIEKNALQVLNQEYTRAKAQAQAAEAEYAQIKAMREEAEKANADLGTMKLSPEMELSVENDPILRSLQNTRLNWEQEMAAYKADTRVNGLIEEKKITARNDKIDEQVIDLRKKLTKAAALRMEAQAKNESVGKNTLAEKINEAKVERENSVRDLGQSLMKYQELELQLKRELETLAKMQEQSDLATANQFSDDTRIEKITDASIPTDITWPKWYVFLPLGTVAGLGLSALLAYMLVLTDTRVRTPRDISRTLQLPMLGFVPDESDDRTLTGDVETAILTSPGSMVAESFRQIRSHITAQTAHNPVNSLLVASITPGGGSTTVAANLAAAMALNDMRVLLVDANFYRPSLGRVFKQIPSEGLAEAINDHSIVNEAIVPHPNLPKLHLMSAGSELHGVASEMFEGKQFRELLEQLKGKYDLIIFDGAPLSLVSDSLTLAARVDGVVSVVRAGEVSRGAVSRVRDQLRGVHSNLLGFVLNAAQTSNTGYFKENYRSFYRYAGKGTRRPASAR